MWTEKGVSLEFPPSSAKMDVFAHNKVIKVSAGPRELERGRGEFMRSWHLF